MLTSSILSALHVTLDYFIVINIGGMIILLVLAIVLLVKLADMNRRYKKFMTGKQGYNLERIIIEQKDEIDKLKKSVEVHDDDITTISTHFSELYSKIHVMKYDAFEDTKGNLSFVLVLLDMKNNGLIMNSIRGNQGNYLYLKELKEGVCDIPLGKEEVEALEQAMSKSV